MKDSQINAAWRGDAPCRKCSVRDLVLFADLNHEDFNLIHLPITEHHFTAGEALYHAEEPGRALFTVREGSLKLVQYLPDGGQRIVRLLRQGDTAGLEILLAAEYEHTAIALQPVHVCRIPREVVERLNRETPAIHRQLMQRWHRAVHEAHDWLTQLSTGSARQRLARLILILAGEEDTLTLPSREDIGSMLGLTTETASRTVAEFRRGGRLTALGGNRFRLDRGAVEDLAHGES